MQELYNKILTEAIVVNKDVLRVDSFLNHQIDPNFILKMGAEFADRFNKDKVTKVLTIESSGIPVALAVGLTIGVPVIFAKREKAGLPQEASYSARVFSLTRQEESRITVTARYLVPEDTVLIIDDFLAHGEALKGLVSIVRQAGSNLAGAGIVIEKSFQRGGESLRADGVRIEALAAIESMEPGVIRFG